MRFYRAVIFHSLWYRVATESTPDIHYYDWLVFLPSSCVRFVFVFLFRIIGVKPRRLSDMPGFDTEINWIYSGFYCREYFEINFSDTQKGLTVSCGCATISPYKDILLLRFTNMYTFILPWRQNLSLIHIWRCRRSYACRSRWSPYH